ncbi:MAG: DUF4783 domain-containing protein [Bacteroidota bacterium]
MKHILFFLALIPSIALANNFPVPVMDRITSAIQSGNASELGKYFDSSVEIAILDNEDIYDRNEAVAVVQTFFDTYRPTSYIQAHKGVSKSADSEYSIGDLTAGGKAFRVYVYMKKGSGAPLIQEVRIDRK